MLIIIKVKQQIQTGISELFIKKVNIRKELKKETPFGLDIYEWKISKMKGDVKFRSIRENGERGTPELRGINLKLRLSVSFFSYYYS